MSWMRAILSFLPLFLFGNLELYQNNVKNREYGKETAQIFVSGAGGISREPAVSEDQKYAAKETLPETDSSDCFSIKDGQTENEARFLRRIADFCEEKDFELAKLQIEEFLSCYPSSTFKNSLLSSLGNLYLQEKNHLAAKDCFDQINPSEMTHETFLNKLQTLYHLGKGEDLLLECGKALEQDSLKESEKTELQYVFAIALYEKILKTPDPKEALTLTTKAKDFFVALHETSYKEETLYPYTKILALLKEFDLASQILLEFSEKNPEKEEEILFQRAVLLTNSNKKSALEAFENLFLQNRKLSKQAKFNWLVLAFEEGLFEEILQAKDELFKNTPEEKLGSLHLLLGKTFSKLKKYDEAIEELKYFLKTPQKDQTTLEGLSSLLNAAFYGNHASIHEEAFCFLQKEFPDSSKIPKALFSKALLEKKQENLQEAKNCLQRLVQDFPEFAQKAEALFELAHLEYQEGNWKPCIDYASSFTEEFPSHELIPFVWRYLAESLEKGSEHKEDSYKKLTSLLKELLGKKDLFTSEELLQWQFLLAKIHFETHSYQEAIELLIPLSEEELFKEKANGILLLSLCYLQDPNEPQKFIELGEKAISKKADLIDPATLHTLLFNTYLKLAKEDPSYFITAADHLFEAFTLGKEIQGENLIWLAKEYLSKAEKTPEKENQRVYLNKIVLLLEPFQAEQNPQTELFGKALFCLASAYDLLEEQEKVYSLLKTYWSLETLTFPPAWKDQRKFELFLANASFSFQEKEAAEKIYDLIVERSPNVSQKQAAEAASKSLKIKMDLLKGSSSFEKEKWQALLPGLKDLILQKSLENEPLHLNAALDYLEIKALLGISLEEKLSLLKKLKKDFESEDNLLSLEYHQLKEKNPQKKALFQSYIQFLDAEIALIETESEELFKQIAQEDAVSDLSSRAKKRLKEL